MAIATAAKQIVVDGMHSPSAAAWSRSRWCRTTSMNRFRAHDPVAGRELPQLYMTMLETAEIVAERYGIGREAQDEYALQSQQRTAQAQAAGRFDAEIVPLDAPMTSSTRRPARPRRRKSRSTRDEGNRPQTTLADLQALKPVFKDGQRVKEGRFITAGNASQLSDGAVGARC